MQTGAVLLVGGRSTRMGRSKADLDWHGEPLAARLARILERGVNGPVVAVRAPGQMLPLLPPFVEVLDDPVEGLGPLQGIAVGLSALAGRVDAAFVSSVDAPLLHPALIERVFALLDAGTSAVIPVAHGHRHPLSGAYRTALGATASRLVAAGERHIGVLLQTCDTLLADDVLLLRGPRLIETDPDLESLVNANTPEEYAAALASPAPLVEVETFGALRARARAPIVPARALRLRDAASAAGIDLDGHVVAAINGLQIVSDPDYPIVSGDRVGLLAADAGG